MIRRPPKSTLFPSTPLFRSSRKASPKDRNIYPLIGDAAAITVIERDPEDSFIHATVKSDGARSDSLIIPAGGLRLPSTAERSEEHTSELQSQSNLVCRLLLE